MCALTKDKMPGRRTSSRRNGHGQLLHVVRVHSCKGIHRIELKRLKLRMLKTEIWERLGVSELEQELCLDRQGWQDLTRSVQLCDGIQVYLMNRLDDSPAANASAVYVREEQHMDTDVYCFETRSDRTYFSKQERLALRANCMQRKRNDNHVQRFKVNKPGSAFWAAAQEYCHVDGRVFVDVRCKLAFFGPWLHSGLCDGKHCGLVIGTKHARTGDIRVKFIVEKVFHDKKNLELLEKLAKRLGMSVLGWITTAPPLEKDFDTSWIVSQGGELQARFRENPEFLTIVCFDPNRLWAFQVNDQVAFASSETPPKHLLDWRACMVGIGEVKENSCTDLDNPFPLVGRGHSTGLSFPDVLNTCTELQRYLKRLQHSSSSSVFQAGRDFHFLFALGYHLGVGAGTHLIDATREGNLKEARRLVDSFILNLSD